VIAMNAKVKGGIAVGMLVGLVAVATAVALIAAVPAPAPAEVEGTTIPDTVSAIGDKLHESGEAELTGKTGSSQVGDAGAPNEDAAETSDEAVAIETEEGRAEPLEAVEAGGAGEADAEAETQRAAAPAAASEPKRHWVTDYKTVWVPKVETVIDAPAHDEPVYETRDVLVCNACGFRTVSGNEMGSHLSAHALKGIDEGYHSAQEKYQAGTRTVPAVTHEVDNGSYQKVESGGHWE